MGHLNLCMIEGERARNENKKKERKTETWMNLPYTQFVD